MMKFDDVFRCDLSKVQNNVILNEKDRITEVEKYESKTYCLLCFSRYTNFLFLGMRFTNVFFFVQAKIFLLWYWTLIECLLKYDLERNVHIYYNLL